jgi:hypothetical protein
VEAYLPAALLHLREGEIVRICGLARAARGQEAARIGKVQQPEQSGGTLRATMQEGETAGEVLARFSDTGLDTWECVFHPHTAPPDAVESPVQLPCEHLAALLSLWVRHPEQFRALNESSSTASHPPPSQNAAQKTRVQPGEATHAVRSLPELPEQMPEQTQVAGRTAAARATFALVGSDTVSFALPSLQSRLEQLEALERRFLETLALAGGSMAESEVSRVFARLGLGAPEELVMLLDRLSVSGWVQPVYAGKRSAARGTPDQPVGWRMPDEALALFPRVVPLQSLLDVTQEAAPGGAEALPLETGLHAQSAFHTLPALLFGVVAQMACRAADSALDMVQSDGKPADLAGRWALALGATPEQVRFCSLLARLLGLGPPARMVSAGAPRDARGMPRLADRARDANTGETPAPLSHEQASDLLLRAYRMLLGRDTMEALRDVALHWLHAHSAHELRELRDAGVHVVAAHQREARRGPDIAAENQAAREQVIDLLRCVPAGRWWSFSSLVEFVYAFRPDFLRGRQQAFLRPQWWLERLEDGRALSLEVRADWRQAEGRYLALLFRRALHWLGLVDLALDERGRLKGFRITPAGAFVLSALGSDGQAAGPAQDVAALLAAGEASRAEATAASCAWRAVDAGRLLVPLAGLDEQTLALLLRWCEPGGAGVDGLVFCPTAERLAAALDAGHDLQTWLAWLEQGQPGEPLSALIAQSRRWAGMYGRVRLYESAALLEVADSALMRELEAAVAFSSQYLDHMLAPDLAVVRADALESLLETLRKRGYAPWVTTDEIPDRP